MKSLPSPFAEEDMGVSAWTAISDLFLSVTIVLVVVCTAMTLKKDDEAGGANEADPAATLAALPENKDARYAELLLRLNEAQSNFAAFQAQNKKLAADLLDMQSARDSLQKIADGAARNLSAETKHAQDLKAKLEESEKRARALVERVGSAEAATSEAKHLSGIAELRAKAAEDKIALWEKDFRQSMASMPSALFGIQEELKSVVFVIDASDSMTYEGLWPQTMNRLEIWLQLFPVQRAALVIFNDEVKVFPAIGQWHENLAEGRNRQELVDMIRNLRPQGYTDTRAALEAAYEFADADAIVLFTDGEPRVPRHKGSGSQMDQIRAFVKSQPRQIPIISVAVGEDERKKAFAPFLFDLSITTGGTFVGR